MRFFEIATVLAAACTVSASPLAQASPPRPTATAVGTPIKPTNTPAGGAPVDELVGFAEGTTGGGDGDGTTVTDCSGFKNAVGKGGVIKINGNITDCGIIQLSSDTSLLGVGSESGFTGTGLWLLRVNNVIIRNLRFHAAPRGKDLIDIETSTNIWIDHNHLSSIGLVGTKDDFDGLLDAKRGSDNLTFSWNKFHDHWKASLVGHVDTNEAQDKGKLRVTYHHNDFQNVNSRLPSIRFGTAHVYSSCYNGGSSGVNARMGAIVHVEHSSFLDIKNAIATQLDTPTAGFANEHDNLMKSSTTKITQKTDWQPSYNYTVDRADTVCEIVQASAGVGVITF